MCMNKINITMIADTVIDFLDNATRGVIFAISKTIENLGAKGVQHCKNDADRKRKASLKT